IVFITMGMFVLLETLFKVDFTSRPIQVFILAFNFVTAVIGGYITALLSTRAQMAHALVVGLFVFFLAFFYLISSVGKEPLWFQIALVVSALPSALAGGYLRDWQRERTTKTQRTQRISI